jgi:hypothetical protein
MADHGLLLVANTQEISFSAPISFTLNRGLVCIFLFAHNTTVNNNRVIPHQ